MLLVDRHEPGRETSFGNAGIIQREGVRPHAFPRDLAMLMQVGLHLSTAARYDPLALPRFAPALLRYWWESSPNLYKRVVKSYAPLIARSIEEHSDLIAAAGVEDLIIKKGWLLAFRTERKYRSELEKAKGDFELYGINHTPVDSAELSRREPHLRETLAGAIHWTDPWTVRNPGALVAAYFELFKSMGGAFKVGDARSLAQSGDSWTITAGGETATARETVITLGPWAPEVLEPLGYRLPLFVKRGYHMHYGMQEGTALNNWFLDAEVGYVIAPMQAGVRLTTGAEFALRDAAPTPIQLGKAERAAKELFPLSDRLDPEPWKGARPCTPDMMPIIGPAPKHRGLWMGIGHAHHGFTLGPATGRVLAEAMTGEKPVIDIAPFAVERFAGTYPK